ncbi:HDOD domain-containing protein [Alteromonas sp. H39]|uniref:HDOD domain-containing protein n=1 Tax=Alteromonas sp. H39 TaxID=3389876 RepID=UPI0039E01681
MTDDKSLPAFDERFDNLLIAQERVFKMLGRRSPGEVSFEESEQGDARRELLHVEKVAIKNKALQEQHEASFIDSVRFDLHELVMHELNMQLESSENLYQKVLSLSDDTADMLDTLSLRTATISRIEHYAAAQPWLYDELMQIVNSPAHRRRDSKGRVIVVESLRTALSFIGIENLRIILPSLVFKRTLPQITDPYPQIKHKLLQYANGTAVAARELARFTSVKPMDAYTLGMLSNLGRCAITRLYFRLFDSVQRTMLEEAQRNRQRDVHDALLKIRPSANYLIALQNEYADNVSADIFEHMHFKRLGIVAPMRSIANKEKADSDTLADVLAQARHYAQVRMAYQLRVVEKKELKPLFVQRKYPSGALEALKEVDIFQLPVISSSENS